MAVKGKAARRPEPKKKTRPTKTVSIKDQTQTVLDAGGTVEPEPERFIRNGQFAASFVRTRFEKNKHGHLVGFDISLNLADEHRGLIPKQVIPRYKEVLDGGVPRIDMSDIKPQVISIALFPEDGRPAGSEILLNGCMISRARVQEIVSKGNGKESRNVRLSFTAYVEQDKEIVNFAAWKHDATVWITMKDHQGELAFMSDDGEEESEAASA